LFLYPIQKFLVFFFLVSLFRYNRGVLVILFHPNPFLLSVMVPFLFFSGLFFFVFSSVVYCFLLVAAFPRYLRLEKKAGHPSLFPFTNSISAQQSHISSCGNSLHQPSFPFFFPFHLRSRKFFFVFLFKIYG